VLRWHYASRAWQNTLADWEERRSLNRKPESDSIDANALLAELAKVDDLAGWNAAIVLARRNPVKARHLEPILRRLATEPPRYRANDSRDGNRSLPRKISPTTQAAAAEAWCLVLGSRREDPIEALASAGNALSAFDLPDEVRGEIFRGIGRWVPPADVPGLDDSLPAVRNGRPNAGALRQAAMEACVLHALWNQEAAEIPEGTSQENPWPGTLLDWQWEPDAYFEDDPVMRRRFAYWLVLTGHPNAVRLLKSQLTDPDPQVRDAALVHLGRLQTDEALSILRTHAKRPEPRVRAMAVKGLAHWGARHVASHLDDESFEVRLSVAEELGRFPTHESAVWLRNLQADDNRQVETAALKAASDWPDSLAIPVLLHGMEHASLATRRDCFRDLRRRTGLKATFPITAGPEARQEAIRQLVRDWNLPTQLAIPETSHPAYAKVNRLRVEELHAYLLDLTNPDFAKESARYQAALSALKESSPDDVPAVEAFLFDQPELPRSDVILDEVLPALSPVHDALVRMQSEDVDRRRIAAGDLRSLAEEQTLSRLAVRRLGERLDRENDGLVWREAMGAVLPDDNEETAALVARAANHPDPGIRQLACEFAAKHRRPDFIHWLLPLLHDPETTVQLAAIEAAGMCGSRLAIDGIPSLRPEEDIPGLRSLLADHNSGVAVAAAIAMSRLGDPQGHDELIRLSRHGKTAVRERVIEAMGSTGQTRFVKVLIGLGWTAKEVRIQRPVLKSLGELVPEESRPRDLPDAVGAEERIHVWAKWWSERQNLDEIS